MGGSYHPKSLENSARKNGSAIAKNDSAIVFGDGDALQLKHRQGHCNVLVYYVESG